MDIYDDAYIDIKKESLKGNITHVGKKAKRA